MYTMLNYNCMCLNRLLISTNLKYILTVVLLSVIIVGLCCMDSFTKDFSAPVCKIQLLSDRLLK